MNKSIVGYKLFSSVKLPNVNLVKVVMVINLWIFLFVQFFVLIPVSAYAAPSADVLTITQSEISYKDVDTYSTKVIVKNSSTNEINAIGVDGTSNLKNAVDTSKVNKNFKVGNNEISLDLKCGDTVTLNVKVGATITKGTLNGPLCVGANSVSTCKNPVGWILDMDKSDEYSNAYFVAKDPKIITTSSDIPNNTYKYSKTSCVNLTKQNYQTGEKEVKVEEVKNSKGEVIQKAETKKVKVVAKIDNTIVQNKDGNFTNKANDFTAEFNKDPNLGWSFKNKDESIIVSEVKIGGKKLNVKASILKDNVITYPEILPDLDLEYTVNNEGVQKAVVIKNVKSFANDLSSIEFSLKNSKGEKIEKKSEKVKIESKVQKAADSNTDSKSVDVANAISNEAATLDKAKGELIVEDQKVVDDQIKELKELAVTLPNTTEKLTQAQSTKLEIEKDRIENKPLTNDTIEIGSPSEKDKVKLGTPETIIQTKDGYFVRKESFSLENGKLTILPDLKKLKETKDLVYPIKIDPNINYDSSKDTFTTSYNYGASSARGTNNNKLVAVGSAGWIYTEIGDAYAGDMRGYLQFRLPDDLTSASIISSAFIGVNVYMRHGGGVTAQITDYCGADFDEANMTWNTQGNICGYHPGQYPTIDLTQNGWRYSKDTGDLRSAIQDYGISRRYLSLGLYSNQTGKDSGFCAKDTNLAPCNYGVTAPELQITYDNASPAKPSNNTLNDYDNAGQCDKAFGGAQNCGLTNMINLQGSNWYNGIQNCSSQYLELQKIFKSNFFDWTRDVQAMSDYGNPCADWNINIPFTKQNGMYVTAFESKTTTNGNWSGWSNQKVVTIDNSPAVRIGALTPLAGYTTNKTLDIKVPEYIDNALNYVTIQNVASANRLDIGQGTPYMQSNLNNNYQDFILEDSGIIRTSLGGACIAEQGAGASLYKGDCNGTGPQVWTYNPETQEFRGGSWGGCMEQRGGTVTIAACNQSKSQKWTVQPSTSGANPQVINSVTVLNQAQNGNVGSTYMNPKKNIQYLLQVATDAGFTNIINQGKWQPDTLFHLGDYADGQYYFRMTTTDRTQVVGNYSAWVNLGQTIVDTHAPTITAQSLQSSNPRFGIPPGSTQGDARFSPNNPTSVGQADYLNGNFVVFDQNLYKVSVVFRNSAGNNVMNIDKTFGGQNCTNGCPVSFSWNGRGYDGNYLVDQKLSVIAYANDMNAQNMILSALSDGTNSKVQSLGNATIDNHGANIAFSKPDGTWTNSSSYILPGQLGGFNANTDSNLGNVEDRDVDVNNAFYCINIIPNCTPNSTLVANNEYKLFNLNLTLSPGWNYVRVHSEDLAYNKRDALGSPDQRASALPDSQITNFKIGYDNTLPVISTPQYTIVPSASGIGSDLTFTWTTTDTYSGVSNAENFGHTYKLFSYVTGVIVVAKSNTPDVLNCTSSNSIISCKLTKRQVDDGNYDFEVYTNDNAGNPGYIKRPGINLKTKTFLKLVYPAPETSGSAQIADGMINYKGVGERGGKIIIKINNDTSEFILDPSSNNVNATTTNNLLLSSKDSKPVIVCDGSISKSTLIEDAQGVETCSFSIYFNNLVRDNFTSIILTKSGISKTIRFDFTFDPTKFTLSIEPGSTYFSPNGDGQFDQMPLIVKAEDKDKVSITKIDYYQIEILNSKGSLVNITYGEGALPKILTMNGLDLFTNGRAVFMADGNYKAALHVWRTINGVTNRVDVSTTFIAKSTVLPTEKVVIMTPLDKSIQSITRGAFNVGGQAPAGWNVDVCVSKLTLDPENCVNSTAEDTYKFSTTSTSTGFFNVIAEIPDTSTKDYYVTAKANVSGTGTKTPLSDAIKTTIDFSPSIREITLNGSMYGVNSTQDIQLLIDGKKNVEDLRGLVIKIRVTQNTEAVDINFGQYSNVNNSQVKDINYLDGHVATINATEDLRATYIPNQKDLLPVGSAYTSFAQVKAAYLAKGQVPQGDFGKRCMEFECEWTFVLAYPQKSAGGDYELKFTAYKGDQVLNGLKPEETTRGFTINGQLPMNVELMLVGKGNTNSGTGAILARNVKTADFPNGIYYTNNSTNTLTIGGQNDKKYTITLAGPNGAVPFQGYITTNSNGFGTLTTEIPVGMPDGDYAIRVDGTTIGTMRLDRQIPRLTYGNVVGTQDTINSGALVPFIRSGQSVIYNYGFDETLVDSYLITPDVAVSYGSVATCPSGSVNCFTNQIPTSGAKEGKYAAAIYAQDIAGNLVMYGNDYEVMTNIKSRIANTSMDSRNAVVRGFYNTNVDYDPNNNASFNMMRANQQDYSLYVDATAPDMVSTFDKTTWRDGKDGILADGISPEVDRLDASGMRYVVRGNTVTLKVRAEQYTRGVFIYGQNSYPNQVVVVKPTSSNCVNTGNSVTVNRYWPKILTVCDLSFSLNMNSDGSQNSNGEANNYYQFQFYPMDNAGNVPATVNGNYKSETVTVYQDKVATPNHSTTISSGEITNQLTTKVTDRGERLSDVEIGTTFKKYSFLNSDSVNLGSRRQKYGTVTDQNGNKTGDLKITQCFSVGCTAGTDTDQYGAETTIKLGTQSDDRSGCAYDAGAPVQSAFNTIRYGACEDGIYTIQTRLFDTSGNATGWITKTIERDTVAPRAPYPRISENNGIIVSISGEGGSSFYVNGNYGGILDAYGNGKYTMLTNYEYSAVYEAFVYLVDKAGNKSPVGYTNFMSSAAPTRQYVCSISSQGLSYPGATLYPSISGFDNTRSPIVTPNGTTQQGHNGIDLTFPGGTEVLAAMDGTLSRGTDQYGGRYIKITKGNMVTEYWHLSDWKIANGTQVTRGQVIGLSGATGLATAAHLHFGVLVNGGYVNPEDYLNCGPNVKLSTNKGTIITVTPFAKDIQDYCSLGEEEDGYDYDCIMQFENARNLNNRTSFDFLKWSDADVASYNAMPQGNMQWVYDQKVKLMGEDFMTKKNEIVGKCVPYWVNEMITKGDSITTIDTGKYISDNIQNIERKAFWTKGINLEVARINVDKSKYSAEISAGTTNTINKIYEKCGANFLIVSQVDDKATQEILDAQKSKITNWINSTVSETAWYYTGYIYNPDLNSRMAVISDDNKGLVGSAYNIDQVLSNQPVVDETRQWILGASIITDSLATYFAAPYCGVVAGATAGTAGLGCFGGVVGGVNGAVNYAGEFIVSQRSGRPMETTGATIGTAMGFALGPYSKLVKRGLGTAEKAIVAKVTAKIATEEVEVLARQTLSTEVGAVIRQTGEVVGKVEGNVVKDSSGKAVPNLVVKDTGEIVDNVSKETLSKVVSKNVAAKTLSKTTFKSLISKYTWATLDTAEHIFRGLTKAGRALGGHHIDGVIEGVVEIQSLKIAGQEIKDKTQQEFISLMRQHGDEFLESTVRINGKLKNGIHTFFPANWSEETVMNKIDVTLKLGKSLPESQLTNLEKQLVNGVEVRKAFTVTFPTGEKIRAVIDPITGIVTTSYPK